MFCSQMRTAPSPAVTGPLGLPRASRKVAMSDDSKTADAVQAFSRVLAAEVDKTKRKCLITRAEMFAMSQAPPEAFEPQPLHVENLAELAAANESPPEQLV